MAGVSSLDEMGPGGGLCVRMIYLHTTLCSYDDTQRLTKKSTQAEIHCKMFVNEIRQILKEVVVVDKLMKTI